MTRAQERVEEARHRFLMTPADQEAAYEAALAKLREARRALAAEVAAEWEA